MKIDKNTRVAVAVQDCTVEQKKFVWDYFHPHSLANLTDYCITESTTITDDGFMDKGREYDDRYYHENCPIVSFAEFMSSINPYKDKKVQILCFSEDDWMHAQILAFNLGYEWYTTEKNLHNWKSVTPYLGLDGGKMNYPSGAKPELYDHCITFAQFMKLELPEVTPLPASHNARGVFDHGAFFKTDGTKLPDRPFRPGDRVNLHKFTLTTGHLHLWNIYLVESVDPLTGKIFLVGDIRWYDPELFVLKDHTTAAYTDPIADHKTDCYEDEGTIYLSTGRVTILELAEGSFHKYNFMTKADFDAKYPPKQLKFGEYEVLLETPEPGYIKIGCQPVKVESLKGFYDILGIIMHQKNEGENVYGLANIANVKAYDFLKEHAKELGL